MSQEAPRRLDESPLPERSSTNDASIDLFAMLTSLRAGKKIILWSSRIGFVLAACYALTMPTMYTATATFLKPTSATSGMSSVIATQLSALGANGMSNSLQSSGQMYVGILQTKTIARNIIVRFNLMHVYRATKMSSAENVLASQTVIDAGEKDNIIRIHVTNHDPKLARDIANAYLDELHSANGRLALTEVAQRRLFFEQQMAEEKDALENAEIELKKTQEKTGLIAPTPQTTLQMEGIAATRQGIEAREIELSGRLQGSTEQDPTVIRLRSEIVGLKAQLSRTISGGENEISGIPTGKVPELQLEYVRKQREVSYHTTLFEILAKQYEAARLDEAHDAPVLQVLDQAVIPDIKSGPKRSLISICGMLLGAIGAMMWLLFRNLLLPTIRLTN